MTNLTPSMRLAVKRDTFYTSDNRNGIYFRNNRSSFRMEGESILQWIEQLLPMFSGDHTLEELTEGLAPPYRKRVWEIAEVLLKNGFVRDASQDRPHQLEDAVLGKNAPQIGFLENSVDSAAYRFQTYRQTKVLAAGSGAFFVSLVSALLESGLSGFHMSMTDEVDRNRLMDIIDTSKRSDDTLCVEEVPFQEDLPGMIAAYDAVLYVTDKGNIEELRRLHKACRQEGKIFLPALLDGSIGMAGPLVHPDHEGCWESAWRRIHRTVFDGRTEHASVSGTSGALLANVIVFELFKQTTGVKHEQSYHEVYLLHTETMEGKWHAFQPHPLVTGHSAAEWRPLSDIHLEPNANRSELDKWFLFFGKLTSPETGIFHSWEEGDLKQLPLAQCSVQVTDPLSDGPASILKQMICSEVTIEEARREAGLSGLEAYMARSLNHILPEMQGFAAAGAGETPGECVTRGLMKCMDNEFRKRAAVQTEMAAAVRLEKVEDEKCRYYLQSLTTLKGEPRIAAGTEISGFPVMWIGTDEGWHGCAGLNRTMALRAALRRSLMHAQNGNTASEDPGIWVTDIVERTEGPLTIIVENKEEADHLTDAMPVLEKNDLRLSFAELTHEPFIREGLFKVYAVSLGEEVSV